MDSPKPTSSSSQLTLDAQSLDALERLEKRIQHTIEELRAARRKLAETQAENERLHALVAEKDAQIERLTAEHGDMDAERKEVRDRIEALLGRVEALAE